MEQMTEHKHFTQTTHLKDATKKSNLYQDQSRVQLFWKKRKYFKKTTQHTPQAWVVVGNVSYQQLAAKHALSINN